MYTTAVPIHSKMSDKLLTDWLPTTKKEIELRGWSQPDVILFSGDAYVDHSLILNMIMSFMCYSLFVFFFSILK